MSLEEGTKLDEFIASTGEEHRIQALSRQTNNPIYGFTGGPGNLCWFYSSLQLLLNTHAYRQLIKNKVSTKNTKCENLNYLFKEFIDKQENYPFVSDVRVFDVGGFIEGIKPITENLKFGFYNLLTTGVQQDPSDTLDEVSECLNFDSFQVNYKTIYYDEHVNTLTYLPLLHNPPSGTALANNSYSVPKASFVFSSTPLIKHRSTEFTSLQQLIDIIPVFPIEENSITTNDPTFISSLKSSSLSRYDGFKQTIEELSAKNGSDGNKKSFNIDDYFPELETSLTTLFNLTGKGFSYDITVIEWFNDKVKKNILRSFSDKEGTTRYAFEDYVKNRIRQFINKTIKTYDNVLNGLKIHTDQRVQNIHNVLEFYEDVLLKPILQNMYDDFTTYLPNNYIIIQPSVTQNVINVKGVLVTQRFNHLSGIDFTKIKPNHVFTLNGKKYRLICIVWHTSKALGESAHYEVEINIVNPKHTSIAPGLYHCNDSSTKKIDTWNFDITGSNPIPKLFVFENAALTPGIPQVDFPPVVTGLSGSKETQVKHLKHAGVVQVFGGHGNWKKGGIDEAKKVFEPIKQVIDKLISIGYTNIGLTYSANQDQTIAIFKKYGFKKKDPSFPAGLNKLELDNNDTVDVDDGTYNRQKRPWWPTGSGQAWVLDTMKDTLNDVKYQTRFRIIPFSTMEFSGAGGGKPPNSIKNGDIEDCINFANLFLEQEKSIILGWCGLSNYHLNRLTNSNIDALKKLNNESVTRYFSIGGTRCRDDVNVPPGSGIKLMITYANWAINNWNNQSQNAIDSFHRIMVIDEYLKYANDELQTNPKQNKWTKIIDKVRLEKDTLKTKEPLVKKVNFASTPEPGLNSPYGFVKELTNRITELTKAAAKLGMAKPNIAIVVNGGSFNPIHNGHLEMFTSARERLKDRLLRTEPDIYDVLVIYVVSPFKDLNDKNKADKSKISKITYDAPGRKYRIQLCREAFASIDDVNPKPTEIKLASDRNHLSKNMFVWPEEESNAYNIGNILKGTISKSGVDNVIFYGLAGSDKKKGDMSNIQDAIENFYFLNGIDGNSIIVRRGSDDMRNFFNIDFETRFQNEEFKPKGWNTYHHTNGKIAIESNSDVSSTNIQPQIIGLRDYLISLVNNNQFDKSILDKHCDHFNKDSHSCIPYVEQEGIIQTVTRHVDLISVPHSILFKLVTYDENPTPSIKNNEIGKAWCGYKEFRRYLFRKFYYDYYPSMTSITNLNVKQTEYNDSGVLPEIDSSVLSTKKNGTIEFLQMTSGHALFIQGDDSARTSVLNFANPTHVGGEVWYGSWVQEETLCMMSPFLYLSLENVNTTKNFENDKPTPRRLYDDWGKDKWNEKIYYTDDTGSAFITSDEFTFTFTSTLPVGWTEKIDPASNNKYFVETSTNITTWTRPPLFKGHVITAAAYDWRTDIPSFADFNDTKFNTSMIRMIQNIAYVAASVQKCNVLVLGAWGCGAFAPKKDKKPVDGYIEHVARLFCRALYTPVNNGKETDKSSVVTYKDLFTKVIFPIPDCKTYDLFKGAFDAEDAQIQTNGGVWMGDVGEEDAELYFDDESSISSVSPKRSISAAAVNPGSKPYITLTNMIANIDSGIDHYVEQISNRNPLREISVNEQAVTANQNKEIPKFSRVDGDFPKSTVPLFEQMIYHRAGSVNLKPLKIFIPTGYKVNFQEINEYFREMTRRNDPETQELINMVINAYGNNNNSLFYRHTLPGKPTTTGVRPIMVGGAYPAQTTMKGVFNLDPKTEEFIQFKIDKWHRSYIDWCFYRNATRFFVENQQLPKGELVTLKIEFDEVYDANGGRGLMKMVDVIQGHYKDIDDYYSTNVKNDTSIKDKSDEFTNFIYLFDILYAEIQKYKNDPLDYVTERKKYFPSYSFDANSRSFLLQVFDQFRSIFIQLKLLKDDHTTKNFIETVPYLSQLETLQSITDEFTTLKQSIEKDPALKNAVEIFEKYMLTSNGFTDVNRQTKHIPSYKIIQYVFQTISYYNDEPRTTPPPPPNGLFEEYVEKLYTGGVAVPKDPKDIFGTSIDDDFIVNLYDLPNTTQHNSNIDVNRMEELNQLDGLLHKRIKLNTSSEEEEEGEMEGGAGAKGGIKRSAIDKTKDTLSMEIAKVLIPNVFADDKIKTAEQKKTELTKEIKFLNESLQAYNEPTERGAYTNDGILNNIIEQVKAKIKLLKGKYFVSSLLDYNHDFITTTTTLSPKEITISAANFFHKFYTESKLETPELDSFPPKNEVSSFSFGIDLIFWVLFRISKYYFASFHANFIEKLKEKIGPQNIELRTLRTNVQYNESKLNHVCEIIAKLLGISVVRIIPDRSSYLIKTDDVLKGFVDHGNYNSKWEDTLVNNRTYSEKIKYVSDKMTKGLDKTLGLADDANGAKPDIKAENDKKMKAALVELLNHNTVQVVHMLFAKPRNIWYSPDMRTGSLSGGSKWAFIRLEKPEIIAKSAFKLLNDEWDKNIQPTGIQHLKIEIVKESSFQKNELDTAKGEKSLCVFLVDTQTPPQMIEPGKDSSNDSRFQNPSFNIGDVKPGVNDDHAVGAKILDKLVGLIKPDSQKCDNVRGLIQEQTNEISAMMKNLLKAAGVDMSIGITSLKNKIAMAQADNAILLLTVLVNPDLSYNRMISPPPANVAEALSIANKYKGNPDFDAIRGYCEYLNASRKTQVNQIQLTKGIQLILDSNAKNNRYSKLIVTIIDTNEPNSDIMNLINKRGKGGDGDEGGDEGGDVPGDSLVMVGGGLRRRSYIGGGKKAVELLMEVEKELPIAKLILARMIFYGKIDHRDLPDNKPIIDMFQDLAKDGYVQAEFWIAKILEEGKFGVKRDTATAQRYYEHAAKQGHIDAAYALGYKYNQGSDGIDQSKTKALKFLKIVMDDSKKKFHMYDYTESTVDHAKTLYAEITNELEIENKQIAEPGDLLITAKKEAENFLDKDAGADGRVDGRADGRADAGADGDEGVIPAVSSASASVSAAAAVAAAATAAASAESKESIRPEDVALSVTSDATSAVTSAVVASSAAASAAVAASAPPRGMGPAPPRPMDETDINNYRALVQTISRLIESIITCLNIYYSTTSTTSDFKNQKYRDIQGFIKEIEDSIQQITDEHYQARVVDTSLIGHYNDDLQAINQTYSNAIKNYDQLTPTLVTFLKDYRIATGEVVVNPKTGDVLFFPGGQRGGLHSFSGGGGSESESGSGSETETKSDKTIPINPQPKDKPYLIPHGSDISRMFAIELHHNIHYLKKNHPELYEKIAEGIASGKINQIDWNSNQVVSSDESMPEAYRTAKEPAVIRNILSGITQTPDKLIKKYDQIVEMCQAETALALIKSQLKSKNIALSEEPRKAKAEDRQILQALGWNNNENRLLYDTNLVRKTAIPTANGLFSNFCYHNGKFAVFMSRHCQRDYSCMLNWIIINAFRLVKNQPTKYNDEQIDKLIQKIHKTIFGDIFAGSGDFVGRFVSNDKNTTFYAESVKKLLSSDILNNTTLGPLVFGIKEEIQKLPEPRVVSRVRRTTEKLGVGGMRNIVTRKHRDFRVEDTEKHTVKNTRKHKIFTISLNKTRRTKT